MIQFYILLQRSEVFVFIKKEEKLFEARQPLQKPGGVDVTARNWSLEVDEVIWFLPYLNLESRSDVISNNLLCSPQTNDQSCTSFVSRKAAVSLYLLRFRSPLPRL